MLIHGFFKSHTLTIPYFLTKMVEVLAKDSMHRPSHTLLHKIISQYSLFIQRCTKYSMVAVLESVWDYRADKYVMNWLITPVLNHCCNCSYDKTLNIFKSTSISNPWSDDWELGIQIKSYLIHVHHIQSKY